MIAARARRGQDSAYRPARESEFGLSARSGALFRRSTDGTADDFLRRALSPERRSASRRSRARSIPRGSRGASQRWSGAGTASCSRRTSRARRGFLAGTDEERAAGYRELLRRIRRRRDLLRARRLRRLARPRPCSTRRRSARARASTSAAPTSPRSSPTSRGAAGLAAFYGPMVAVSMAEEAASTGSAVLQRRDAGAPSLRGRRRPRRRPRRKGRSSEAASRSSRRSAGLPRPSPARGAVLFWEDVGEDTYRLDRMLTQLERSGTFDRLQAMVIGSISPGARGGESPESRRRVAARLLRGRAVPGRLRAFRRATCRGRRTLPLGRAVRVDASAACSSSRGPAVA